MPFSLRKTLSNSILQHLLFWLVYSLLAIILAGGGKVVVVSLLYSLPPVMFGAYTISYVIIPRFLLKKKYVMAILLIILCFLLVLIMDIIITQHLIFPYTYAKTGKEGGFVSLLYYISWEGLPIFLFSSIKLLKLRFKEQIEKEQLAKENVKAELALLKAQLHPHFLFNTLNNIYYLALEKSDKTPVLIEKISVVLRSVLYECNTDKISIEQETNLIENFIELEKIRYEDAFSLEYNNLIDNPGLKISPLILFTFVENSFKHGVSNQNEKRWIQIHIETKENKLYFRVKNSKVEENNKDEMLYRRGIGLRNVKRRLHLLYPNAHSISIKSAPKEFSVELEIELNKE